MTLASSIWREKEKGERGDLRQRGKYLRDGTRELLNKTMNYVTMLHVSRETRHAALPFLRLIEKTDNTEGRYIVRSLRERKEAIKKKGKDINNTFFFASSLLLLLVVVVSFLSDSKLRTMRFCSLDLRCEYAKNMNSG